MRARVVTPFFGKDRESPRRVQYVAGDEIDGELAEVAVREKWAEPIADAQPKEAPADDPKPAAPPPGKVAPANKAGKAPANK